MNLETCSEHERFAVLDGYKERYSVVCYVVKVMVVRMALRFLNRKDLAEKVELLRRPAFTIILVWLSFISIRKGTYARDTTHALRVP